MNTINASGLYAMDNEDLFDVYGVFVESGSDDFLKMPTSKDLFYSKDWADENGLDVYLKNRKFKSKDISLTVYLRATSEADFWAKKTAFENALIADDLRTIFVKQFERSFDVYYTDCTSYERLTSIKGKSEVIAKYVLKFTMPVPTGLAAPEVAVFDNNSAVGDDGSTGVVTQGGTGGSANPYPYTTPTDGGLGNGNSSGGGTGGGGGTTTDEDGFEYVQPDNNGNLNV